MVSNEFRLGICFSCVGLSRFHFHLIVYYVL